MSSIILYPISLLISLVIEKITNKFVSIYVNRGLKMILWHPNFHIENRFIRDYLLDWIVLNNTVQ